MPLYCSRCTLTQEMRDPYCVVIANLGQLGRLFLSTTFFMQLLGHTKYCFILIYDFVLHKFGVDLQYFAQHVLACSSLV